MQILRTAQIITQEILKNIAPYRVFEASNRLETK